MISSNPESVVRAFNECINNQDIEGLSYLMTENHTFIDRDGTSHSPKHRMVEGWRQFFAMFPDYRNTFQKIVTSGNGVSILGFAYWSDKEPYDPVIWTAVLEGERVSVWQVHKDTPENRRKFRLQ